MCGFFKRNCLGLQKFLPLTQTPLVFAARSCRDLSSWHWNLGLWGLVWGRTPQSQDIPPEFLSTTYGWGTSLFCVCTPSTSLDGCGFFNSIVVRLPFNSIFDSPEWWLFYILVVILMWLCEEVSHVCLRRHLDWKSSPFFSFPLLSSWFRSFIISPDLLKWWSKRFPCLESFLC